MPNGKCIRWNNNGYTYIGNSNNQLSQFANYSDFQEVKTSVSNGKSAIASAITDKGVSTASDATFQTMANNIRNISTNVPMNLTLTSSTGLIDIARSTVDTTPYSKYVLMSGYAGSDNSVYLSIYIDRSIRKGLVMQSTYHFNSYPNKVDLYCGEADLNNGIYKIWNTNVFILNNGDTIRCDSSISRVPIVICTVA